MLLRHADGRRAEELMASLMNSKKSQLVKDGLGASLMRAEWTFAEMQQNFTLSIKTAPQYL